MKKLKQILALAGVVILVGLYLLTFISSFIVTEYQASLFQASIYATIIIPIFLYGYMLIYRVLKKDNNNDTLNKTKGKEE